MLDTVIFDMDGVIIDSEPIHIRLENEIFHELGVKMTINDHSKFVGRSAYDMWSIIIQQYHLNNSADELNRVKNARFLSEMESSDLNAIPHVLDAIEALYAANYTLLLASSADSNNIQTVLDKFSLHRFFKSVTSGAKLRQSKPHPEIFLNAANSVRLNPSNCLVIEDSANGVIAAKSAGMACIGFINPNSGNQDLSQADITIKSFENFLEEVNKIQADET